MLVCPSVGMNSNGRESDNRKARGRHEAVAFGQQYITERRRGGLVACGAAPVAVIELPPTSPCPPTCNILGAFSRLCSRFGKLEPCSYLYKMEEGVFRRLPVSFTRWQRSVHVAGFHSSDSNPFTPYPTNPYPCKE